MSADSVDSLATHRPWFDTHLEQIPAWVGVRFTCPCCGYPTLPERNRWEICSLCNWEDDGQDDPHADEVWGGPNYSYSLSAARANFKLYLIKFSPKGHVTSWGGNSNTPIQHEAKRKMVVAFNSMTGETDPPVLHALWEQVLHCEKVLENGCNYT